MTTLPSNVGVLSMRKPQIIPVSLKTGFALMMFIGWARSIFGILCTFDQSTIEFWEIVNGTVDSWIVTGTPSIGKTFFTFYMFVKIRKQQPTAIIAWVDENGTLIFYPNGTIQKTVNVPDEGAHGIGNLMQTCQGPSGCFAGRSWFPRSFIIIGASWKKGFEPRCMLVWSIEEIHEVHAMEYSHHKWEVIEASFDKWGGVPRTVLEIYGYS